MFDHLSITVTDLDRAQRFYDAVLAPLGVPRVNRRERAIGYGERAGREGAPCYISVYLSDHVVPDNRHWCFRAPSRAAVRTFHAAALEHGGSDDGPPGLRERYGPDYYAAFVRDPDGNRLEALTRRPEEQE
ncbi:Catechol 2,3-dioxygenase [Enhydrobacter aerosaccus]|uniref:Catechol 2,3-dioxygenase n=1 Tax=Enhydrobacter aerosaccus TaxID=225324 RepID=A0A1T4K7L7_9HYPH|nr:VOC family protein [Enhydrobacter aerosaccus]SJZ38409.1 Catechol 2,3-dioxygenase [Enhydrobacter aerosaccus]